MISVDTTFLVDLWRNKDDTGHPAVRILEDHGSDTFVVPAHAAGEFLEGGAFVSERRFEESLRFLSLFGIVTAGFETAKRYAAIVALLRRRSLLVGASKADLWIAASALEHGTALVTRNARHFGRVPDLRLIAY
jgi:predicted nucleic acid-binding protein